MVLVELILVETVLVGDPLYEQMLGNSQESNEKLMGKALQWILIQCK